MGEMSEAILNGEFCESCGEFLDGEPPGHPRKCKDCLKEEEDEKYGNKPQQDGRK